ncbi:MAG: hypothetical protein D6743_15015 [Calditrichaeota bacterium]|nr:MAG: hypothetical protein D6743_15015 [Calditrichota bacterium]
MLKIISAKTVGTALRFKHRYFSRPPSINILEHLAQAKRVLVFMPSKIDQFAAALKSLETLRRIRPEWKITAVTRLDMVSLLEDKLKVEILPYSKADINVLGLPKPSMRALFQKAPFDLALDLKMQFDLMTVVIFQLSRAPLRVCFDTREKSPFYNLGIRVNSADPLAHKYETMVKYVTLTRGKPRRKKSLQSAN